MSMPTSRSGVFLGALLALSACIDAAANLGPPLRSLAVADGAVTVSGPSGYCVDRRLSQAGSGEAFVVLGSCAALADGGEAPAGPPALLTATVSGAQVPAAPGPDALERFLRSEPGRSALARDGRAESVTILRARREQGLLLLQIRDTSPGGIGRSTDSAYWRAVFAVRGRLVTATVLAFDDRPLSSDLGFRLLGQFVARLRAANPGAAA